MAATYNTIINMTHISGEFFPLEGGILPHLESNGTQVASTSPSVDAPANSGKFLSEFFVVSQLILFEINALSYF